MFIFVSFLNDVLFFYSMHFLLQTLKFTFQALKYILQTLKRLLRTLEYKKSFYLKTNTSLSLNAS